MTTGVHQVVQTQQLYRQAVQAGSTGRQYVRHDADRQGIAVWEGSRLHSRPAGKNPSPLVEYSRGYALLPLLELQVTPSTCTLSGPSKATHLERPAGWHLLPGVLLAHLVQCCTGHMGCILHHLGPQAAVRLSTCTRRWHTQEPWDGHIQFVSTEAWPVQSQRVV
jgi:hypothetical protein